MITMVDRKESSDLVEDRKRMSAMILMKGRNHMYREMRCNDESSRRSHKRWML